MESAMKVENLDHLGIVAGLIDEIGMVELLNERLGTDPREKVSTGIAVKAMLLNGLGFVSAPLYLFEHFFKGKATEKLLGEGIKAENLNDDRLGKTLDKLYEGGLSDIFVAISLQVVDKFGIKQETAHLDSSSFHVDGQYETKEEEAGVVKVTYGYSRDHRPDLKQFVMNLICLGDGDIPVFMEIADGNQSDKARFAQLCQEFKQQWTFDGLWVADGALYSADNLKTLEGLTWLTRVPLSIKEASILVDSTQTLAPSILQGYSWASFSSNYGDVSQRWLLIESEKRRQSDLKQLTKKIEKYYSQAEQSFKQLSSTEFACATDALKAAHKLSSQMNLHQLSDLQVIEKPHYGKVGKPGKDDVPQRLSYHVTASIVPIDSEIETQRRRCGRFILATNVLDSDQLSPDDALQQYKAQQGVERGFRFLKDPLFFASSVFLKSPKRVAALGLIMALCLLVYNLGQRQLRLALAQHQETIPNQLGKPTASPTLRWVFQCFMAVHFVVFRGVTQVVNLTDERLHILQFFSPSCRRYYLLSVPDS
jgi:transposase